MLAPFCLWTSGPPNLHRRARCDSVLLLLVTRFSLIVMERCASMASIKMNDDDLLAELNALRDTMVAVATGGPRIQSVQAEFEARYDAVDDELKRRRIANSLPYRDLWQWYGRWSSDLPSYQARRMYVADLFNPLLKRIKENSSAIAVVEPTGWARVDRTVDEIRSRLAEAATEEQFQAIGLLCREALISLAQSVFDPTMHPTIDGVPASDTDAKRMLEAFIAVELSGGSNEEARAHTRSGVKLALALQHRRTATFRDAALCAEAATAVINIVAIISGRRDPT